MLGNSTLYIVVIISTIFYSLVLSLCWGNNRDGKNINTNPLHSTKFLFKAAIFQHDATSLCNWFPLFQDNSLFSSSGAKIFCTFWSLHCLGNAGNQLVSKTHYIPGEVSQQQCYKNPKLAKAVYLDCCKPLCLISAVPLAPWYCVGSVRQWLLPFHWELDEAEGLCEKYLK